MSGFTTTGAWVVTDFTEINRSLGMWRQFTQWLGGMGIIVLAIAVLPRLRVGGRQLMESELPGPGDRPALRADPETARKLWVLYLGLTVLQTLLLASMGWIGIDDLMTPYQALAHAFSTMPTGGFSTQPRSAEEFAAAAQWILAVFMLVAGANFALMSLAGFVRGARERSSGTRSSACTSRSRSSPRHRSRRCSGRTGSPRARPRSGPGSSRRSRS